MLEIQKDERRERGSRRIIRSMTDRVAREDNEWSDKKNKPCFFIPLCGILQRLNRCQLRLRHYIWKEDGRILFFIQTKCVNLYYDNTVHRTFLNIYTHKSE